jgi:hypothetical protein
VVEVTVTVVIDLNGVGLPIIEHESNRSWPRGDDTTATAVEHRVIAIERVSRHVLGGDSQLRCTAACA